MQEFFLKYYPEFTSLESYTIDIIMKKVSCLYPEYEWVLNAQTEKCEMQPFFMLVAHYLVMGGYASKIGIQAPNGVVSNSSIDSVSVSFATAPNSTNFTYFLNQTKYGQEYLAYVERQNGLRYFK